MNIMSFWWAKVHQSVAKTDATPFLSDVYNNSTRARKKLAGVSLYALRWLLPQNVPDTKHPDDDVSARSTSRKAESAGNGVLSNGEKNFNVHKMYMNFSRPRKRAPETAQYAFWGSLLPENGTNATPFLSDVYKKGTRAKKRLAGVSLYGRSMVEMLGVLAIIGVLSVGAIAGYQKAMHKYRLNKQQEQIRTVMTAGIRTAGKWKFTSYTGLLPFLIKMGEVPQEMYSHPNVAQLQDVFNNNVTLDYAPPPENWIRMRIFFAINSQNDLDQCRNIYILLKEFHNEVFRTQALSGGDSGYEEAAYIFGEAICKNNVHAKCLKDLSLKQIDEICRHNLNKPYHPQIAIDWYN